MPPPDSPSTTIVLLSLAAFASAASMRVMDALLVRLSGEYGVGLASASNTVTVFAVLYGLLQLELGPLGDRHGKLRVITAACGASAVASLACALAPSYDALLPAPARGGSELRLHHSPGDGLGRRHHAVRDALPACVPIELPVA